jgi:hypothetical protein
LGGSVNGLRDEIRMDTDQLSPEYANQRRRLLVPSKDL